TRIQPMLPETAADPDIEIQEVIKRELLLLRPEVRERTDRVGSLLDDGFREIGSSGQMWDRETTLAALRRERGQAPIQPSNLKAARVSADVILITYRSDQPRGQALRSSVWVRGVGDEWRLSFHQGTRISG
ncbi:MAG: nuclear transport factor 2 family protein, partial [Candidatus Dormibacteria bacterium]